MPRSKKLNVQTPGQPVSAEQMPPQEGEQQEAPTVSEQEAPTVSEQEMIIEAEVQRRLKERMVSMRDAKPQSDLPDQSEIDPKEIERPVLSSEGWVVPATPEEPIQGRKLRF